MYSVSSSIQRGWRKPSYLSSRLPVPQIVLFVAPLGLIADCFKHACEREFAGVTVEQVADLEAACVFDHPVRLMLIDASFSSAINAYIPKIQRAHPDAIVALTHDRGPFPIEDVLPMKEVRGVLPMNSKLDIWLSIMRLLLDGGDYFPVAMLQSVVDCTRPGSVVTASLAQIDAANDEVAQLTERETQILEMISRGLQNKVVAVALDLSVHTVKIHIHNIIRKLGVHNRTEAAAVAFQRHRSRPTGYPGTATTG